MPKARKLATKHRQRNQKIAIAIGGVTTIAVAVSVASYAIPSAQQQSAEIKKQREQTESVLEIEHSNFTVESAKSAIDGYYSALRDGDATKLRELSATDAANALERNWLAAIGYELGSFSPNVDAMPEPVGVYAGKELYSIESFFKTPPVDAIKSNVFGQTTPSGWMYYETKDAVWKIIDPTIPTATEAPEAQTVDRKSEDSRVTVSIQSPGAFSNPWWCYTQLSIEMSSTATDYGVSVTQRQFDGGLTASVPTSLLSGLAKASSSSATNVIDGGMIAADSGEIKDGVQTDSSGAVISPVSAKGVCSLYRGEIKDFSLSKIGQRPLSIDGDIMPFTVETSQEDVTPIFAIGDSSLEEIKGLLTEEEMSKYGLRG